MTDTPAPRADPPIRASDAERDQTQALLRRHFADGRLTFAELEERVAGACEATTRAQLRALTADLPDFRAPMTRPAGTDWRILCVLLCICPPAGLAYWLLTRR
jgi:hypothetical protein